MTDVGKKLRKPSPRSSEKLVNANMYTLGSLRASFSPRHALYVHSISVITQGQGFNIRIFRTILVCLASVFSQSHTG